MLSRLPKYTSSGVTFPIASYDFSTEERICNKWYALTRHPDIESLFHTLHSIFDLYESYPGTGQIEPSEADVIKFEELEIKKADLMLRILRYGNRRQRKR